MSAPAALAASKLLYPETKRSKTTFESINALPKGQEANILDAAGQGVASVIFLGWSYSDISMLKITLSSKPF